MRTQEPPTATPPVPDAQQAQPSILQAQDLRIGHGRRIVAGPLTFSIRPGDIIALLGPNGSGKSTLFRTLLGLLPPLGGTLLLDGLPLAQWRRRALAQRIGYVPQSWGSHFGYSVLDTVLMGRAAQLPAFAQPSARDRTLAMAAIERLGIAHLASHSMHAISGGERQLALIARALVQDAALLIMDEPTSSLDFGNQLRVLEQIRQLRTQGVAVLLSTHQPDHALAVADQIMAMMPGEPNYLLGPGPKHAVATSENLAALYGVPVEMVRARMV